VTTVLVGYGSHGKDIEAIWKRTKTPEVLIVCDEDPTKGHALPDAQLFDSVIFGSNYPAVRYAMAQRIEHGPALPVLDPAAVIGTDVFAARGCVIAPAAVLLCSVYLGVHVHVNYGAQMTRCTVGEFSTISPGATICGDVNIGRRCLIGAGATVCDRSAIGHDVTIGAGAIVPPQSFVPDGVTVIGVWKG